MTPHLYLAPLSGVTDLSFRLISREFGAGMCFFEMIDARALLHDHPRNRRHLKTTPADRPIAAQLLGSDPATMLDAAHKLVSMLTLSSIDINCACPAKKVMKKGAGAALLKNQAMIGDIIHTLASRLSIPVTVKLRTGLHRPDTRAFVRLAELCQANGAAVIYIHGRTVSQGYAGGIDYPSIRAAKEALTIPVFGSGDILDPLTAKKMLEETGCDGILAARGALGNPWIFKNIERYLAKREAPHEPGLPEKKEVLRRHLAYIEAFKDIERRSKMGFMGKVAMWYLKGLPYSSRVRERICRMRSYEELTSLIDGLTLD